MPPEAPYLPSDELSVVLAKVELINTATKMVAARVMRGLWGILSALTDGPLNLSEIMSKLNMNLTPVLD